MTRCKYLDCDWCYAPDDVKTNALESGGCIHSECCPYLKSQNQMKSFNINSTVKVRLTKYGKELHKKEWEDLWSSSGRLDEFPYEPPDTDADGYEKFQMWDLMGNFGEHCGWGGDLPFDTTILIEDNDLKGEVDENKLLKECRQTGRTTTTTEKVLKTVFSQIKETDIAKFLIEGDIATIMGVKYQRIIEPQSFYDKLYGLLKPNLDERVDFHDMTIRVLDLIRENIPECKEGVGLPEYSVGYNDGIREVNENLFK